MPIATAQADCRNDPHAKATVAFIELPAVPDLGTVRVKLGNDELMPTKDGDRWRVDVRDPAKSFVILEQPIVIYSGETELLRAAGGEREPTKSGGCVAVYKLTAPIGSWFVRVSTAPRPARFDYGRHRKETAPAINAKGRTPVTLPNLAEEALTVKVFDPAVELQPVSITRDEIEAQGEINRKLVPAAQSSRASVAVSVSRDALLKQPDKPVPLITEVKFTLREPQP